MKETKNKLLISNENIKRVNLTIDNTKTRISAVYSPSDNENQRIKIDVCENLGDTVKFVGLHRYIILMGDFNGRTRIRKNLNVVKNFLRKLTERF